MPKNHQKPEQIISKLRDADAMLAAGKTIGQVCQSLAISEQAFHRWRAQYGGMKAEEAKPEETRHLVIEMAKTTGWGYRRILGELKKLGIRSVSRSTIYRISPCPLATGPDFRIPAAGSS
jgi:hypothetical protein